MAFFLCGVLCITAVSQTFPPENLDAMIENGMQAWNIPGLAIAIVHNDSIVFARGYGVRRLGESGRADPHTVFAVASNTKAFTATLLAMLVDRGKINWDDPVISTIPELQMNDPYVTQEITIRDLLTHRSGLPTFGGDHLWIGNTLTREEIISRLRYLEPAASFRSKYQYQNLMFLVAGQIIPRVSSLSWDEAMVKWILEPMAMTESSLSIRQLENCKNVASPHEIVRGKMMPVSYDNADAVAPAAALNSTVMDMARWMRFNLGKGLFKDLRLVSERRMHEIHQIQFAIPVRQDQEKLRGTRFSGYGLGWYVSDYRGAKVISHGGGLTGMISLQTLVPEKNLGIIILTNFAPNSFPAALTNTLLDIVLGADPFDWFTLALNRRDAESEALVTQEKTLEDQRIKGTKPSLNLEMYTGTYTDPLSGEASIRLENGRLIFDYNPRYVGDLTHWHQDTFRVIWRHPIFDMEARSFLHFQLDESGNIKGLRITFYDPLTFTKIQKKP